MVFSSTLFVFCFLPIMLFFYMLAYKSKKIELANIVLLLSSMFFYAWGGISNFLVLIVVVVINYLLTIMMNEYERLKKVFFVLILLVDVGNLLYFKYFNFFVENIKNISSLLGCNILINVITVTLPIGISFYTFQIISYVIDVYMGKVEVQRNLIKFALYVLMFPQLIAGPIVRYKDVNDEISNRKISRSDVEYGIRRFIVGFFKKVFLANSMGSVADTVFGITWIANTAYAWLGAICYALQIYYDFSAYSDMAIGLGRIFGFHFNENFDLPYKAQSIQEFWRRWHISLSSWFRDYVYIPLGGNRKGVGRTYLNLIIVFFLTGFWHGAAWQFIIWGIYHGFFLIVERMGFKTILEKIPSVFRHVYTIIVVVIGWVFFRADNIGIAISYLKNMFSFNFLDFKNYYIIQQITSLSVGCFIIALVFSVSRLEVFKRIKWWNSVMVTHIRYLILWGISVLYLIGLSYNPFIYFKF